MMKQNYSINRDRQGEVCAHNNINSFLVVSLSRISLIKVGIMTFLSSNLTKYFYLY